MVKRHRPTTPPAANEEAAQDRPRDEGTAPRAGRGLSAKPVQRRAEAHDDSALESIGKAATAPVLGAANPDDDEKGE